MTTPRGRNTERKTAEQRLQELEQWRELWVDPKIKDAEESVRDLVKFQRWVLGAAMAIGAAIGFFSGPIKRWMGLG
jgi:hypothetical protein